MLRMVGKKGIKEVRVMINKSKIRIAGVLLVLLVSMPHLATAQTQEDLPPGITPKGEATNFKEHVARINANDKFLEAYGILEDDHCFRRRYWVSRQHARFGCRAGRPAARNYTKR